MIVTTPEWLAERGGLVRMGPDERNWLVMLGPSPEYKLVVLPAKGRFTAAVTQTVNGKRLDKGIEYADAEAAVNGGLDELRQTLGW